MVDEPKPTPGPVPDSTKPTKAQEAELRTLLAELSEKCAQQESNLRNVPARIGGHH